MTGQGRLFGWTGCPAALACWHYRKNEDGKRKRATALCRACSKAAADMARRGFTPSWKL